MSKFPVSIPGSICSLVVALLLSAAAVADESSPPSVPEHVPCDIRDERRLLLFGDTHVHTAYSLDAATQDTRNKPDAAYRFAKGEKIGLQPYDRRGNPLRSAQLAHPLDFTVITDHAEMLGEVSICSTPGSKGYYSWPCLIHRYIPRLSLFVLMGRAAEGKERFGFCGKDGERCLEAAGGPWQDIQRAAEMAYDRSSACSFTSFVGYEWTGTALENIHRNIVFRNAVVPELPVSFFEENVAEKMWERLDQACVGECDWLSIPHNTNLSGGAVYPLLAQRPMTNAEALRRARKEPIVEIFQHKGSSECWFGPGVEDELCDFELLPYRFFRGSFTPGLAEQPQRRDGFLRYILNEGLLYADQVGANPYRIGFIGSTDTHLGTPGLVSPIEFPGHGGAGKPATAKPKGLSDNLEYNPGGLAAVWATENTREAIFKALLRRETYSTSGPRIGLRFFGGWNYEGSLCSRDDMVASADDNGVPMGGVLKTVPRRGAAPTFLVNAIADPGTAERPGMPLQRIQVIKGWVDRNGQRQTRVYDIAGDADNGATVDTATCEASGGGSRRLCAVWRDPEFDAERRAWYYTRVLENPSCRWSALACNAQNINCADQDSIPKGFEACCLPSHKKTVQQRALSSPIWYENSSW